MPQRAFIFRNIFLLISSTLFMVPYYTSNFNKLLQFLRESLYQRSSCRCRQNGSRAKRKVSEAACLAGSKTCSYYSNSIVAGGFPVQSYSTLLTPFTSLTIRLVTFPSTSHGSSAASAVMKSEVSTARSAMA